MFTWNCHIFMFNFPAEQQDIWNFSSHPSWVGALRPKNSRKSFWLLAQVFVIIMEIWKHRIVNTDFLSALHFYPIIIRACGECPSIHLVSKEPETHKTWVYLKTNSPSSSFDKILCFSGLFARWRVRPSAMRRICLLREVPKKPVRGYGAIQPIPLWR